MKNMYEKLQSDKVIELQSNVTLKIFVTQLLCHFVPWLFILFIITHTEVNAQKVLLGIDVLQKNNFSLLDGKNVGLITNHTGVNSKLVSTVDLFKQAKNFKLVAVFSPEHGLKGFVS